MLTIIDKRKQIKLHCLEFQNEINGDNLNNVSKEEILML
jgi:hypothetical protein